MTPKEPAKPKYPLSPREQTLVTNALHFYRDHLPQDTHHPPINPLLNSLTTPVDSTDQELIAIAIQELLQSTDTDRPLTTTRDYLYLLDAFHDEQVLEVTSRNTTIIVQTDHFYEYHYTPKITTQSDHTDTPGCILDKIWNSRAEQQYSPDEKPVPSCVTQALTPALKKHISSQQMNS